MFCLCSLLMKFRRKKPHTDFSQRLVLKKRLVFSEVHTVRASVFVSSHSCAFFPLCALLFLRTPPFCRFRVCYLDFALSSDSVVFWIIPLPCSFGIPLPILKGGVMGKMSNRRLQYNRRKDYLAEGCSAVFFFEL